jgi:hypothetical protein
MIEGGVGGARTLTGLAFERDTSLETAINNLEGFRVVQNKVYKGSENVGIILGKHSLYTQLLEPNSVDWKNIVSKKLLPDDAFLNYKNNTLYIIEKKYQQCAGSVDEKLQTCDFKVKQYRKLLAPLNIEVEYIYVLNNWFLDKSYTDVLAYITSVNCSYYFEQIPMNVLGLTE